MKTKIKPDTSTAWRNPIHFIAFGFGVGVIPVAPGTWGTLAAIPFYLLIQHSPIILYSLIIIAATLLGIWACGKAEKHLGIPDYPGLVWDEFVGYWLVMLASPPGWLWIGIGFILFRIFDILKPWPIRLVDHYVKGGVGIMLDDLLAAIPAWLILQALAWYFIT